MTNDEYISMNGMMCSSKDDLKDTIDKLACLERYAEGIFKFELGIEIAKLTCLALRVDEMIKKIKETKENEDDKT